MKIAVLLGGWSDERSVSLLSGEKVASTLLTMGYRVVKIDVRKNLRDITEKLYDADPDVVFNALHGKGGEDGTIQGILSVFGRPYTSSHVLSSALCFNKSVAKSLVSLAGGKTVQGIRLTKNAAFSLDSRRPPVFYPFVIKPESNGSSIGVSLIFNEEDFIRWKKTATEVSTHLMIEKYISGREFTVLVKNGEVIGSLEILPRNAFYDYESKYEASGALHQASFSMEPTHKQEMMDAAKSAYAACFCSGIARVDFVYDRKSAFFLEINTQPGLTPTSLAPEIYQAADKTFEAYLEESIRLARTTDQE
jgi:D-alanine-D-alanine ligase